jgi:chromosomal replication initiator protein
MPALTDASATTWSRIQDELRSTVSAHTYDHWLAPLRLDRIDGNRVVLIAPHGATGWVSTRFGALLNAAAERVLGPGASVDITAQAPSAPDQRPLTEPEPAATFNPKYTFEQFVIGDANRLAHAAALAVAELPGQAYNPLFIHGPPGLGKTHLLHAIANYVTAHGDQLTVRYTTAEAFTNQFLAALQHRDVDRFKAGYRASDVLLIDDIQFLQRKARTEEEFFHTFNSLYETGAQLVLTSDKLPADMPDLAHRLRERFESGLVTDVQPPDFHTRLTILRKRAAHDGVDVAEIGALEAIARRITSNIRTLEGALIRVVAYHSLTGRPVDQALAEEVLDRIYPAPVTTRPPTIDEIQAAVCDHFKLTPAELCSSTRTKRVTVPRQIAMYLARELTSTTLPAIGDAFGGRNHATVLHACKATERRLSDDPDTLSVVNTLTDRLTHPQ